MGKYEKSATGARGGPVLPRPINSRSDRFELPSNQNGLTMTRITIPIISTAGASLTIR
jgi:hypothetical protein